MKQPTNGVEKERGMKPGREKENRTASTRKGYAEREKEREGLNPLAVMSERL